MKEITGTHEARAEALARAIELCEQAYGEITPFDDINFGQFCRVLNVLVGDMRLDRHLLLTARNENP